MFHSLCANGIKREWKKNRVKYGCWQFDFICINESKLIFANTFIYSYCNIIFFFFSLFHSIYNLLYVIPFILKWPYNIYSIRIYVLSIFGMDNGLSISFLNSKITFFVVFFFFFNFFSFLRFPLFSQWLSDCLYLKLFQWVHVKVLAKLEILESNSVCYYGV